MSGDWTRVYPAGPGRWGVIAWEAGGLAYLHWTTVRLFALVPTASWLLAATFALTWTVGSWKILRMGLYLSPGSLMIRGIIRTRTIPWTKIATMTVEEVTYRVGRWLIPAGKSVILTLNNGQRLNAAMWEKGMDFHSHPQTFKSACQTLRYRIDHRHTASTPLGDVDNPGQP